MPRFEVRHELPRHRRLIPRSRRVFFEPLEQRSLLAVLTWVGDVDANWNTNSAGNTNWNTNTLPADGDTLIFNGTGANFTQNNDTAALNSYTLQYSAGGYTLGGNPISLDNGGTDISSTTGTNNINTPFTMVVDTTLDIGGTATVVTGGVMSGGGGLTKLGTGTLNLNALNTYTGNNLISAGIAICSLTTSGTGAFGAFSTAVNKITVQSGATVDMNGSARGSGPGIDFVYGLTIAGSGSAGQGALVNNGPNGTAGNRSSPFITLSANATIGGTGHIYMINSGHGADTLTLNNFTLTKIGSSTFFLDNTTVTAGTIDVQGGGLSQISAAANNLTAANLILANTAGVNFTLNSQSATVNSLSGGGAAGGNVVLGALTLTVNQAGTTTFSGAISGTGSVMKTGAGVLTLAGTSSYSGTTTVTAGTLTTNSITALGTSVLTMNGGTLNTSVNLTNNIVLNNTTNTIAPNNNYRLLSGAISGAGGFIVANGGGTPGLEINNPANSFAGNVTINSGTYLRLSGNEVIPNAATVTDNGNFRLDVVGGGTETIAGLTGTGSVWVPTGNSTLQTLVVGAGNISSSFGGSIGAASQNNAFLALRKIGTGNFMLTAAGLYTAGTTVSQGALQLGNSTAAGTGTITLNDAATGANDTSLFLGAGLSVANPVVVANLGTGISTLGTVAGVTQSIFSGTVTLNKSATLQGLNTNIDATDADPAGTRFDGALTGAGGVTVTGGQMVQFRGNGVKTYSGSTQVTGNTVLSIWNSNGTSPNSAIDVAAGSRLQFEGVTTTIPGLTGTGEVRANSFWGTTNLTISNAPNMTFGGLISGSVFNLTKDGAGTLALTGPNTYAGTTTINAGIVDISNGTALGTGAVIIIGGGTLDLRNNITVPNALTLNQSGANGTLRNAADNNIWSGSILVPTSSQSIVNVAAGTLSVTGNFTSNGFANKTGPGLLIFSGVNGGSGWMDVSQGLVSLRSNTAAVGTYFHVNNPAAAVELNGGVSIPAGEIVYLSGIPVGSFAPLNGVNGANTFGGTVVLHNTAGNRNIGADAGSSLTLTGAVTGNGRSLTKVGGGTVTLAGTNTYDGMTTVSTGMLVLQNGNAILNTAGAVTVGNGATLQLLSSETVSSFSGAGDIGLGSNDSLLVLGANTLTTTGSAAIANVTTAAGGGIVAGMAITDADDDMNITGVNVFLQAATGVGTALDPLETAVSGIQLRNTTSGVINVSNTGPLTISDLRAFGYGARNDAGATSVINSSQLTIAAISVSSGPVLFESTDKAQLIDTDFNANNGGFTVVNSAGAEDPWTYNSGTGKWFTNGTQFLGTPTFSELNSAIATVATTGPVSLSFSHRYSFEFDGIRWDGGQVRISVNGGAFTPVPNASFSANGYIGAIEGNNILTGQDGFNGDSPGYGTNTFITSVANLGTFTAGDTIRVQFVGAWDEFVEGTNPNWEIDSVSVGPPGVTNENLTINAGATVQSTGSSVTLNAGDNLTISGNVTSANTATFNTDAGNVDPGQGGNLAMTGVVTTPAVGSGGGAFLNGQTDNDTFTFNPQTTTEFRVAGNLPSEVTPGDLLIMNVSGTTNPNLTVPGTIAPYTGAGSGSWTFTSAHLPVLFSSIEQSTISGNHHLTYDNSVTPVANLIVMRDSALPTANLQLRNGSTAGPFVYQGSISTILSLKILGSSGNDTVTVDDVNTLPDFAGTVPGVDDNGNLVGTAELLFDGLGGNNSLVFNLSGATASQTYAIGNGTGTAGLAGEVQSNAAGLSLQTYFQNVELTQRTGSGAMPGGLSIIGDLGVNTFSIAGNIAQTRTTAAGYTPFEFSGNNYSLFAINALGGADSLDLISFGTAQTNNPAITLSGGSENDSLRVRSTSLNTGLVTLHGNAGSDLFQLFDALNTVDNIAGPVVIDGADGNVGGNTDTLTIVDSGDTSGDSVVISPVDAASSGDYSLEGMNTAAGSDVVFRNVDVLNYTGTSDVDSIDGRFVNTVPLHDLNSVVLSGWTGADQFLLLTSDQIGGSGSFTPTGVASGLATIRLYGDAPGNPNPGDGLDTFGATPAGVTGTGAINVGLTVLDTTRLIHPSVSTSITIDGGTPTGLAAPLGDVIGDALNVDVSALPNATPVIVSTFLPGRVVASGIQPLTWSQIEDLNLVDGAKLTNVQMGDLFARTTPVADLIQLTRNPTPLNPSQVRLRISATIGNYSASNKTILYGGGMNDTLTQANLTIPAEFYGEAGDDYLSGALNNDWLVGGEGNDRINGSGGDNVIWGDNAPTIPGDPTPQDSATGGDDQLSGLGGNDVFYGGGGNDLVSAGAGNDYAYGGEGSDMLDGFDGDDRLYGGAGNDTLNGHAGNDLLSGAADDDKLYGNDGNDVLFGGTGADSLDGGAGSDLLVTGSVANETSSWTSAASTSTYSAPTYTLPTDNDAALLTLLGQWSMFGNRGTLGTSPAITHDGTSDEVFGGSGDDDFCWEMADVTKYFPSINPPDYNAPMMGTDERFGPT